MLSTLETILILQFAVVGLICALAFAYRVGDFVSTLRRGQEAKHSGIRKSFVTSLTINVADQ